MSKIKTLELVLPAWMACPLVNGDTSALSLNDDGGAEDEAKLERLEKWIVEKGFSPHAVSVTGPEDENSPGFRNFPSFDSRRAYGETLGGDFEIFTFLSL